MTRMRGGRGAAVTAAISIPVAILVAAFASGYAWHAPACEMCLWQRWLLLGAAVAGLVAIRRRGALMLCPLLMAASAATGGYQVAVQHGVLPGPQACTASRDADADPIDAAIVRDDVRCDEVAFTVLGLSPAAWNLLLSGIGAAAMLTVWGRRR